MSSSETGWRQLVRDYLAACREQTLQSERERASNPAREFALANYTDDLLRVVEGVSDGLDPIDPDEVPVEVIDEDTERVVVELPSHMLRSSQKERLLLRCIDGTWFMDDVLWPCLCNLSKPGVCSECLGTGHDIQKLYGENRPTPGAAPPKCPSCGGTLTCQGCAEDGVPGWRSYYRLDG